MWADKMTFGIFRMGLSAGMGSGSKTSIAAHQDSGLERGQQRVAVNQVTATHVYENRPRFIFSKASALSILRVCAVDGQCRLQYLILRANGRKIWRFRAPLADSSGGTTGQTPASSI